MFREKLKKDLSDIHPDEALLKDVTKMMQEEAQKPRTSRYISFAKYGGMAAAVCMIAVGAIALSDANRVETESGKLESRMPEETAAAESYGIDEASMLGIEPVVSVPDSEIYIDLPENARNLSVADYVAVYKGTSVDLSDEQVEEIALIGRNYAEKNTAQMIDLAILLEQAEEMGENGLYFAYDDVEYVGIYISGDESYLCCGQSTYRFSESDKVLAYFE